jgi:hypothetical protein
MTTTMNCILSPRGCRSAGKNIAAILVTAMVVLGMTVCLAVAQPVPTVEIEKAKVLLDQARSEYQRTKGLVEREVLPQSALDRCRADLQIAALNYREALIRNGLYTYKIIVDKAIRYETPDGERKVRITLRNAADQSVLVNQIVPDSELNIDLPTGLSQLSVSLKQAGTIIALPYEKLVGEFPIGAVIDLEYTLLRDVDEVTVSISHLGGTLDKQICLQSETAAGEVSLSCAQPFQECDLGSEAIFELTVERFERGARSFKLGARGLPPAVSYEFVDPQTSAKLSSVTFLSAVTSAKVHLRLYLPDRASEDIAVNRPIRFYAVAGNIDRTDSLAAGVGRVLLEVVPTGASRLEITSSSFYYEVDAGEEVDLAFVVKNIGTRALYNVRLVVEKPDNWIAAGPADVIAVLDPDMETSRHLAFTVPDDAGVGDFEVRVRAESRVQDRIVAAPDKTFRIHVASGSYLYGTIIIMLLLSGLVVGIIFYGVRLSRR